MIIDFLSNVNKELLKFMEWKQKSPPNSGGEASEQAEHEKADGVDGQVGTCMGQP